MRPLTVLHFLKYSINEEHSTVENESIFPLAIFFFSAMLISEHRR